MQKATRRDFVRGCLAAGLAFDNQDKEIKSFASPKANDTTVTRATNFVEVVRSRDAGQLHAPVWEGHLSTACAHMANVSYRLGAESDPEAIRAAIRKAAPATGAAEAFADVFERYERHRAAGGVAGRVAPGVLGAWVTLDAAGERFVGAFADRANAIATRPYRAPFVVPTVA